MAGDVTDTVEGRLSRVETQVVGLRSDVQKLRVLEEANAATIRLIAEGHGAKLDAHDAKLDAHDAKLDAHDAKLDAFGAKLDAHGAKLDAHDAKLNAFGARLDTHGRKLDEITEALKPLAEIHDFVKRVAHEHEIRIVALESRAGGKQPEG
jgi:chromosome segregation ATPase